MAKSVKKKQKREDTPTAYGFGVVALVTLALVAVGLVVGYLAGDAAVYMGFVPFAWIVFCGPFWLICAIACFVSARKASVQYKRDLILLGLYNVLSVFLISFVLRFEKWALLAWVVVFGVIFGMLIYWAWRRRKLYGEKKMKVKVERTKGEKGMITMVVAGIAAVFALLILGTMFIR